MPFDAVLSWQRSAAPAAQPSSLDPALYDVERPTTPPRSSITPSRHAGRRQTSDARASCPATPAGGLVPATLNRSADGRSPSVALYTRDPLDSVRRRRMT
ncbi:hypothetical protein BDW22DRAFT_1433730 [Trametopsis cervina]|nr:hypothetical protein BDW22DRAFT_1433730 [Trametopsis cervina]